MSAVLVAFVPDLMDRSRLQRFAPTFAATPGELRGLVDRLGAAGCRVVVDLARPGVVDVAGELVAAGAHVVGFAPHVDDELRRTAAAAGVEVVARSRFFSHLEEFADRD